MVSKATRALQWPVYRPRNWGQPAKARALPRPWFGLDTERDATTGEYVCGWAVGETTFPVERFYSGPPGTYWVYNLAYDMEGMLRDLGDENAWAARADGAQFSLLDGVACYYHGKRFDFRNEDGKWSFLEASAFNGRRPLSTLGEKQGGVKASEMSITRYQTEPEYRALVDSYCGQDARIVYEFVERLADGLGKIGISLGATPGATARRFLGRMPAFPPLIWQTHKAFLRSYCGGRFEIVKRGVFHDARQYDIVSAYPWALAQCPWLTETAYTRQGKVFSDTALYGSYLVDFDSDDYLGLAPCWKKGVRVYSASERKVWLARPEVDYLNRHSIDHRILRSVEIFDENAGSLWRDVILELFAMKRTGAFGWGPKIVLNSQYGILIQLVPRSGVWVPIGTAKNPIDFAGLLELEAPEKAFEGGKYFAPVYAGNLTALVRVRVLEAGLETGRENFIGGHTDSILTMGHLGGLSAELGGWQLEKEVEVAHVCKTGFYGMGNVVKMRGITRQGSPEMLWDETLWRQTRVGIKSAQTWGDVSVIRPKEVKNNFFTETKRDWDAPVTRGLIALERFVDSKPWRNVNGG